MKQTELFEIKPYQDKYKPQILTVWEQSVRLTHDFLKQKDFDEIKKGVESMDFNALQTYCMLKGDVVVGFMGVAGEKIEALFIGPEYMGQGLGKRLISFAINELGADKLDVNEQNIKALNFYEKLGFEVTERTDKDDQGRNYPLLRMKLNRNKMQQ